MINFTFFLILHFMYSIFKVSYTLWRVLKFYSILRSKTLKKSILGFLKRSQKLQIHCVLTPPLAVFFPSSFLTTHLSDKTTSLYSYCLLLCISPPTNKTMQVPRKSTKLRHHQDNDAVRILSHGRAEATGRSGTSLGCQPSGGQGKTLVEASKKL